jgi:hypothetical protein
MPITLGAGGIPTTANAECLRPGAISGARPFLERLETGEIGFVRNRACIHFEIALPNFDGRAHRACVRSTLWNIPNPSRSAEVRSSWPSSTVLGPLRSVDLTTTFRARRMISRVNSFVLDVLFALPLMRQRRLRDVEESCHVMSSFVGKRR